MTLHHPLFSVIIPTCHRNEALALCLERLAPGAQTLSFDRYEVIVTDDGCETTAEAMIRERFPWARWTQGPRRGPAANRNHGASLARGEWLAFTDDDCLPEPVWLEAYASATRGEARALEGAIYPIGDMNHDLAECPVNLQGGLFASANIAVRRDSFRTLQGFDERYSFWCEDQDFLARLGGRTSVPFVAEARVGHPVRVLQLRHVLKRIPKQVRATALYYAQNARRLGVMRFTTLIRWLYKPRLVGFLDHAFHFRLRSALVESLWLIWGNALILREYVLIAGRRRHPAARLVD